MDHLRQEAPAQTHATTPCDSGFAFMLTRMLSVRLAAKRRVKPAHKEQGVNAKIHTRHIRGFVKSVRCASDELVVGMLSGRLPGVIMSVLGPGGRSHIWHW